MIRHGWIVAFLAAMLGCSSSAGSEPWTLQKALDHALAHNPDARLAQARIAAAQAGVEQANAAFWPRLQFQSSYTRTDNPMLVFGSMLNQSAVPASPNFNDVPDADDANVKGIVTVPLYAGGRNKAGREAAKASSGAARSDREAVRNALGFEVARAFHTIIKTREFIGAVAAAVNAYQTNLVIATRRLAGGSLLKTDVLDLQVRLAQAQEDLVRAQNAYAMAKRVLRNLLAVEEANFTVDETSPDMAAPPGRDFSRRAELAAARFRELAAEEQVRAANAGYFPRLSAFGNLDYDYGWKFDRGGGSYTAGGLLEWDIWNGNLTRAKAREARANLDAAREQQRKLSLTLDLEVEQATLDLKAANERIAVTQQTLSQASESAELTRSRFEQGTALSTQLMDAETALVNARVRRAEAEGDRRIAIAALKKALGLPQLDPAQPAR